jgi:hypothetical protein
MKTWLTDLIPVSIALYSGLLGAHAQTASVTDWHTYKNTATTLSGQSTDAPIMGSTANSSSTGFLVGYLSNPLSLVNVGDRISLTYNISFNDATGMASGNDNFRFALYDLNGETRSAVDNTGTAGTTDTDGVRGYWFGVMSGTGTASGSMRKRTGTTADQNLFANASATALGTVPTGDRITYNGAVNGIGGSVYSGELTLELTLSGVALSGSFGGNGQLNTFSGLDNATVGGAFLANNFEAVAFFNGSGLSADQILLQNVAVTYTPVPEPSAVVIASSALLGILCFRTLRSRNGSLAS